MRIAFCVHGITWSELQRTEFYRQDYEILEGLGHDVAFVSRPWRLGPGFDLAFVWWWNYLWMWGPVARARGLPILTTGVFDLAVDLTWPAWKRAVKRWGIRFSDRHIFVSREEHASVTEALRLAPEQSVYGPLAVDTDVYKPAATRPSTGTYRVLNIAWQRLTNLKRKKVFELLEAFALLHQEHPDSELVLAGPPEDGLPLLRQRAAALGVARAVRFPGELTREEKVKLMQECSLYCQVSEYEGFGLAIAEAMACGAPVLVSPVGAVPEVVGDCGDYVSDLSTEGIRAGLMRSLADRRLGPEPIARRVDRIKRLFARQLRRDLLAGQIARVRPQEPAP